MGLQLEVDFLRGISEIKEKCEARFLRNVFLAGRGVLYGYYGRRCSGISGPQTETSS